MLIPTPISLIAAITNLYDVASINPNISILVCVYGMLCVILLYVSWNPIIVFIGISHINVTLLFVHGYELFDITTATFDNIIGVVWDAW